MPKKLRYNSIPDVGTADKTQNIVAQTSKKNTSFHPLRIETRVAPVTQKAAGDATTQLTETENGVEHAQIFSEDEDYDPEADEVESWDDFVDNLCAKEEAVSRNKPYKSKDTDYWSVVVSDGGVTRMMNLSIREAIVLPPGRQIILEFNTEMQAISQAAGLLSGFLGSLGADFQHFSINEDSWKTMDKALKEHAYDTIKRTFLYEEDDRRKRKKVMIQRLEKIWKEARNHLYHKCYDEQMSWEENLKKKPSRINIQQWRWFVNYRLKESTKEVIANIESQDGSSKEISLTDSLAQVLGKEHSGRVWG
ncbi:hypothetical protein AHAS_Ahas01G0094400 [Arachis hypogaea]